MPKILTTNVALAGPDGPVVLLAGITLPEWATDKVGSHALAEAEPAAPKTIEDAEPDAAPEAKEPDDTEDATGEADEAKEPDDTEDATGEADEADDEADIPDFTGPAPRTRRTRKKA